MASKNISNVSLQGSEPVNSTGAADGASRVGLRFHFADFAIVTSLGLNWKSMWPALLRFLPRPGVWMERFKQAMAFPLFATAAWLVWVFGIQTGVDGVLTTTYRVTMVDGVEVARDVVSEVVQTAAIAEVTASQREPGSGTSTRRSRATPYASAASAPSAGMPTTAHHDPACDTGASRASSRLIDPETA